MSKSRPDPARALNSVVEKAFRQTRERPDYFLCEDSGVDGEGLVRHGCSLASNHVTECYGAPHQIDLFGGPLLSAFVVFGTGALVIEPFCRKLNAAKFLGVHLVECTINVTQTKHVPPPLFLLEAQGRNCAIPEEIVDGANACPTCGWGPVLCPECGERDWRCVRCGQELFAPQANHDGEGDRRIMISDRPSWSNNIQIDAGRWQGEDFINCRGNTVVTRRVIDWLKALPAGPWVAFPLQAELQGLRRDIVPRLLEVAGSQQRRVERMIANFPDRPAST
jgi:hypothetical protein